MKKVENFEELTCWQEARELVKKIFMMTSTGPLAKEFTLANQLKRASLSAMNNIAEGFSRYHKGDFIRFLDYAQSSSQEVKSLLYVVGDMDMLTNSQVSRLQDRCNKIKAMILSLIKYLNKDYADRAGRVYEEEIAYKKSIEEEWMIPDQWTGTSSH